MSFYNDDENFWYDQGFSPYFRCLINTPEVTHLMNIHYKLLECEDLDIRYYLNKLEDFNTSKLEVLELELYKDIYEFVMFRLDDF